MLLTQYDNYMQGHRDMMQNGGPARTEDDVIRRFEDAVQQVKKALMILTLPKDLRQNAMLRETSGQIEQNFH